MKRSRQELSIDPDSDFKNNQITPFPLFHLHTLNRWEAA